MILEQDSFNSRLYSCLGLIHSICFRYENDLYSYDDMFQEICMRLWEAYPNFNGKSKYSTYAYKIANNTAIDIVRKANLKKRIRTQEFDSYSFKIVAEEYCPIKDDNIKVLYAAINRLNQKDKKLILNIIHGFTNIEIAELMNLKVKHVGVLIFRAKEKLKLMVA